MIVLYAVCGVMLDMTERKQVEKQLQDTLDRVRTLSRRVEAVREEERARIARELHDELGVGLTCLKIDLARLSTMIGESPERVGRRQTDTTYRRTIGEKIRAMMGEVDGTITMVQRIVAELRPPVLDDLGLVAAVEWMAQDFEQRTGVMCDCTADPEEIQVDPERATVVFRICQEALTNVARHAAATSVTIRLEKKDDLLRLDISDNGCGIPQEKLGHPHSFGLLGMRERAGLFGGRLDVTGGRGQGTIICLRLPASPA